MWLTLLYHKLTFLSLILLSLYFCYIFLPLFPIWDCSFPVDLLSPTMGTKELMESCQELAPAGSISTIVSYNMSQETHESQRALTQQLERSRPICNTYWCTREQNYLLRYSTWPVNWSLLYEQCNNFCGLAADACFLKSYWDIRRGPLSLVISSSFYFSFRYISELP